MRPAMSWSLPKRQQRRIATRRGRVDRDRAFGGETQQVVRAAGFRAGAGQVLAAERLHADHGTDLIAVDVAVADLGAAHDVVDRVVDAAVDAEREAVAGRVDRVESSASATCLLRQRTMRCD